LAPSFALFCSPSEGLEAQGSSNFGKGVYGKYDEGHAGVADLHDSNVDQSPFTQLDLNPTSTVGGLQEFDRAA